MNLPASIDVGFYPVRVARTSDDTTDAGSYCDDTRTLFVDAKLTESRQALTFLHELVHLALADHDVVLTDEQEERVADAVSHTFAEFIRRAPEALTRVADSLNARA